MADSTINGLSALTSLAALDELAVWDANAATTKKITRDNLQTDLLPTLAQALATGNTTGGTDIVVSDGDSIVPATDGNPSLGSASKAWATVYVDAITTVQGNGLALSAADAAADTDGDDVTITAGDGGAHTSNNPDGGDIVVRPGAAGSGGSGADGRLIVRQPGGVEGTDELLIYDDGTRSIIRRAGHQASFIDGDIWLQNAAADKRFSFAFNETWNGRNANWISTDDEALGLQVSNGFYIRLGSVEFEVDGTRTTVTRELEVNGAFNHDGSTFGALGATPAAQIAHVADPAGGAIVDAEARTAIDSILSTLETFGFHATS